MEIYTTINIDGAWAVYKVDNNTDSIYTAKLMRKSYFIDYFFADEIILHKTAGEWFSDHTNKEITKLLAEAIEDNLTNK